MRHDHDGHIIIQSQCLRLEAQFTRGEWMVRLCPLMATRGLMGHQEEENPRYKPVATGRESCNISVFYSHFQYLAKQHFNLMQVFLWVG